MPPDRDRQEDQQRQEEDRDEDRPLGRTPLAAAVEERQQRQEGHERGVIIDGGQPQVNQEGQHEQDDAEGNGARKLPFTGFQDDGSGQDARLVADVPADHHDGADLRDDRAEAGREIDEDLYRIGHCDPVAAVIAVDEDTCEAALRLIKVDYEILPTRATPQEAYDNPSPRIHEYGDGPNVHKAVALQFGDVDAALMGSAPR